MESQQSSVTSKSSFLRSAWRCARWLAVAYLALCLIMVMFEESLTFFPDRYPAGDWNPSYLDFEDAWFQAADGTQLHGWYCPHEQPRAVVLFAHGNAGNLSHRAPTLRYFQQVLGCTIMIFDYRGFGRSAGRPNEAGVLADARAARSWLAQRAGVDERDVVLLGESIGGAIMIDLAAHEGARGLIVENTFTSLPEVAAYHYSWLPVRLLMRSRYDSINKIDRYHGPLLMCHGDGDRIVPVGQARRLYDRANDPKQLVIVPGGDHNDPPTEEYLQEIDRFLSELPEREPGG